jgi:endo-alpha-1,4-polygalactosaminidase (GH114 family)
LHTSSAEYIGYLEQARAAGLVVLTVDYALAPDNVAAVYAQSRALGFVPFAGARTLDRFIPLVP